MKLNVDKEADALYLRLDDSPIVESEEVSPGVVLDYNEAEEEDVCKRDLLRAFVASAQLLLNVGCIDERDDPVKRWQIAPSRSLHSG